MNIIESLKNIGLNEKEAKVYVALLQFGRASAHTVAKHSGLKTPITYVILDELASRGIARKAPRGKVLQYSAIDPKELFERAQSRIRSALASLPELEALAQGKKKNKVQVSYYEGLDGLREMYRKFLKETAGESYVGFGSQPEGVAPDVIEFYNGELQELTLKAGVERLGIMPDHPALRDFTDLVGQEHFHTFLKTLPLDKYNSSITIEISNNLTLLSSLRYQQGIVIDNRDIADTMRSIFKLIWKQEDCRPIRQNLKNNHSSLT